MVEKTRHSDRDLAEASTGGAARRALPPVFAHPASTSRELTTQQKLVTKMLSAAPLDDEHVRRSSNRLIAIDRECIVARNLMLNRVSPTLTPIQREHLTVLPPGCLATRPTTPFSDGCPEKSEGGGSVFCSLRITRSSVGTCGRFCKTMRAGRSLPKRATAARRCV